MNIILLTFLAICLLGILGIAMTLFFEVYSYYKELKNKNKK